MAEIDGFLIPHGQKDPGCAALGPVSPGDSDDPNFISQNLGIPEWFRLEETLKPIPFHPLPWARTPPTVPGSSKPSMGSARDAGAASLGNLPFSNYQKLHKAH